MRSGPGESVVEMTTRTAVIGRVTVSTMTEQAERELLAAFTPWLRKVSGNMCRQFPERAEDLAQEGWIAMWRSISNFPGDVPTESWLKASAIKRMYSHIRDWTARCRDVRLTALAGAPGMHVSDDRDEINVWDALQVDLGEIELAYHHGEIAQAIGDLPPKQRLYVVLKHWAGYTDTEMIAIFGYRPRTLGVVANQTLAKKLVHLATVDA